MSTRKNPVGFIWLNEQSNTDPNCITLVSTTSHKLGTMLGTFEDEQFSQGLESYIDLLRNKAKALERDKKSMQSQLEQAQITVEVLAMQRLYLACFLGVSAFFLAVLLSR